MVAARQVTAADSSFSDVDQAAVTLVADLLVAEVEVAVAVVINKLKQKQTKKTWKH